MSTANPEHAEGAFYVWTKKEIDSALGDAAEMFDFHYGVQPHGNAPEGSDPQDEFRGKNILIERHTIAETAKHFKKSEDEVRQSLARSREKLLSIRAKRPRPHLDDKIIASWNGLMISAYARAAQVLNEPRYLESATRAAKFLRANLYDQSGKVLFRNYREGRSDIEGFADDYAFVIQGLIDLYEASFDVEWLKFAIELQETQDRLFFDEKNGGYFSTSGKDKSVVLRMKDDNDSAEPAASSVAALNLLRLAQFRDDKQLEERGKKTIGAFSATLSSFPARCRKCWSRSIFVEQTAANRDRWKTRRAGNESVACGGASTFSAEQDSAAGRWSRRPKISRRKKRSDARDVDGRWKTGRLRLREFHLQSAGDFARRATYCWQPADKGP